MQGKWRLSFRWNLAAQVSVVWPEKQYTSAVELESINTQFQCGSGMVCRLVTSLGHVCSKVQRCMERVGRLGTVLWITHTPSQSSQGWFDRSTILQFNSFEISNWKAFAVSFYKFAGSVIHSANHKHPWASQTLMFSTRAPCTVTRNQIAA